MGLRPCVSCGRRFLGKAQHVYVTIMMGVDESKLKGPRCQECFRKAVDWLEVHSELVPDDGVVYLSEKDAEKCIVCAEPAQENCCIFATDYAWSAPRRDWYGRLCLTCAKLASDALTNAPVVAT